MAKRQPNPFALLRLPTSATRQEVVERGKELIQETTDDKLRISYRDAIEKIIQHPMQRLENIFWEMPETEYEHSELRRYISRFSRNPIKSGKVQEVAEGFIGSLIPDKLADILLPFPRLESRRKPRAYDMSGFPRERPDVSIDRSEFF